MAFKPVFSGINSISGPIGSANETYLNGCLKTGESQGGSVFSNSSGISGLDTNLLNDTVGVYKSKKIPTIKTPWDDDYNCQVSSFSQVRERIEKMEREREERISEINASLSSMNNVGIDEKPNYASKIFDLEEKKRANMVDSFLEAQEKDRIKQEEIWARLNKKHF